MPQLSAKRLPTCRGDYENMRQRDKQGGTGSETCSDLLKLPGEAYRTTAGICEARNKTSTFRQT